jgi:hypothetical protein
MTYGRIASQFGLNNRLHCAKANIVDVSILVVRPDVEFAGS